MLYRLGFQSKGKKNTWVLILGKVELVTKKKNPKVYFSRNKELLEQGVFKLKSFGQGKFGRVLGEVFVAPDFVGEHITECISNPDSSIDLSSDGWVSVNDILIEEVDYYLVRKRILKMKSKKKKRIENLYKVVVP